MGDAIAHFTYLGEILDILAKIFVNKNAIKAQFSGFGRNFFLVLCSKVRFGAKCGRNLGLEDLATLGNSKGDNVAVLLIVADNLRNDSNHSISTKYEHYWHPGQRHFL